MTTRPLTSRLSVLRRFAPHAACALGLLTATMGAKAAAPYVAPHAADTLRATIGNEGVARLEDAVYSARDSVNQVVRQGEKPRAAWAVPQEGAQATDVRHESEPLAGATPPAPELGFLPSSVTPPFPEVAAPGDGQWLPVGNEGGASHLFKTMLHPDPSRTWAELFVVAIDVRATDLHLVAGRREPLNEADGADKLVRSGSIPASAYAGLLAAFNGGFKTTHGHFGARVDGVTLVPPKKHSCSVGERLDGSLAIGTWSTLREKDDFVWLRQTPGCLVEGGELHPGLVRDDNTNWGATLDGGTVIRRSAIGLSEDGATLYVGISNDTTARALALGMKAAGARTAAQLDVNYSYPRFMLYEQDEAGAPVPESLVDGFVVHEAQYLKPEARDFFYLTRKDRRSANVDSVAPGAG